MVVGAVSNIETLTPTTARATTARVDVKMRRPSALLLATAATAAAFSHPPLLKPLEKFQRVPPPQLSVSERGSPTPQGRIALAALAGLGARGIGVIDGLRMSGALSLAACLIGLFAWACALGGPVAGASAAAAAALQLSATL